MNKQQQSDYVKKLALQLGFQQCGIARAEKLVEEEVHLDQWLTNGYNGEMNYMANNIEMRLDPRELVPGAKSVVSLLYNYYPEVDIGSSESYKLAKYAYGEDYHFVIKDKLKEFMFLLNEELGPVEGRVFVDSAPVMERQWAQKSGLGWLGKNSLLLNKSMGSFFFIAELIIDLPLAPDQPVLNHCGTCTKCIDACPTDAIPEAGVVDGSRCISYLTIELKEAIPTGFDGLFNDWVFGCDICQDVCPWNRFSQPNKESRFSPSEELTNLTNNDWEELTDEVFAKMFKKSALKRTKLKGLKRNIEFAKSGKGLSKP